MTSTDRQTKGHRVLRTLLWGLLSLVLLVVVVLTLAALPPGESIIRGKLESILSSQLHQPVTIGSFETNLFSHVQLTDIAVRSASDTGAPAEIEVDRVAVNYSLWPLLRKEIDIKSVRIDTVNIRLLKRASGRYNFALLDSLASSSGSSATQAGSSSFTFKLGSAILQSLSIEYTDSILPMRAALENMSIQVESADTSSGYSFAIRHDTGYVQYSTFPSGPLKIDATGQYTPELWRLDTLDIAIEQLTLAGHGHMEQAGQSPIEATLRLEGDPQRLIEIVSREFDLPGFKTTGELRANVDVAGTAKTPKAKATLNLPDITYNGVQATNGVLAARWEGDSVFVDSVRVNVFDGRMAATGYVLTDTMLAGSASVKLDNIRLASLWRAFYATTSPYKGQLNASIDVSGTGKTIDGWKADGSLLVRDASYRDEQLDNLDGSFSLADGVMNASLKQEYLDLQGRLDLRKDSLAGSFLLAVSDLKPFAGIIRQPELTGSVRVDADLSGTVQAPRVEAEVEGRKIVYRNLPLDTLAAQVTYADSQLTVSALTFAGQLENVDSSTAPMGIQSLSGSYRYSGHAAGALDSLQGQFDLYMQKPGYGNIALDSGLVAVSIDGPQVDLDTLNIYEAQVNLQARGDYDLNTGQGRVDALLYDQLPAGGAKPTGPDSVKGTFNASFVYAPTGEMSAKATGANIDISALRVLSPDTLDIAGMLGFDLDFRGDLRNPHGTMNLAAERPRYKDVQLDSARASVAVSPDSVNLSDLSIYSSDENLVAQAVVGFGRDSLGSPTVTRQSHTRGKLISSNLKLKGIEPFLPKDMLLAGLASLNLNWNGTVADPNLRGSVDIKNTELIFAPQDTVLSGFNLAGTVQDSTVEFDTAFGAVYHTPFTLNGTATVSSNNELSTDLSMTVAKVATITGKGTLSQKKIDFDGAVDSLDLALLQPFIPMIDTVSGVIDARVSVKGTADNPIIDGFVVIHGAVVKPGMLNEAVTGGTARITFNGDSLSIDTLAAQLGGGTIALTGQLTHQKMILTGVNLNLKAHTVKLSSDKQFTAKIDSVDLTYTRKGKDRYLLSGNVGLGTSKLTRNFDFQSILPWANSVKQVNTTLPPIASQTDLDVTVIGGDSLWVDNNIARARMSAGLGVIGNMARPNLTGQVNIQEGYLIYLDRRFNIQQGQLYFADPNKLNPDINFLAQANVTTYQATQPTSYVISVSVTGSLEEPVFNLSSEPPLSQSDIVSVLTLGATLGQLSGQESTQAGSAQQVLLDRAATLGSEQLTGAVTRRLGDLLDLDQLTVQGSLFNSGSGQGPSVLVAKQVSNRVRLTYSTTVGRVNDQNIRLDYRLTTRLSLQSETDQQGNASLSFKYGFKFK